MMMKRIIEIVMAIAIISLSLALVSPVKAYVFYSETWGTASTTTHWGIPLALVGEYTTHVLKLGVKGISCASATARGSMYVWGIATQSGWVAGTLKWYMRGTLVAPFLGVIGIINDAWITVKFQAIEDATGNLVEKVLLHEHADPIFGTQFDGEYSETMNIPLYNGHLYKFVFDVEVHAEVLGVIAVTVADFGGAFWSDSRIEWRFIDVPNVRLPGGGGGGGEPCPTLFVWNSTDFVDYGVIDIHDPTGEDVIREVPIAIEDVGIDNYKAKFRLREGWEGLSFSESVIDQVKLYAIGNDGNRYQCPLIKAVHDEQGNVLLQLLISDDYKVKITLLETIDLTFVVPYQDIQGFTFIIEGNNMLKP